MKCVRSFILGCTFILSCSVVVADESIESPDISEIGEENQLNFSREGQSTSNYFDLVTRSSSSSSSGCCSRKHPPRHPSHHHRHRPKKCRCKTVSVPLGVAGFQVTDQSWYTIETLPFPITVPLSENQNTGSVQGDIQLTPTGLLINEPGNYSINFLAVLQNPIPAYTAVIPVFVTLNGSLDPSQAVAGSVVTLPTNFINVVQGTGILQNVIAGTSVALIATNGGSPEPQPITVISWNINLFKIADEVVDKP